MSSIKGRFGEVLDIEFVSEEPFVVAPAPLPMTPSMQSAPADLRRLSSEEHVLDAACLGVPLIASRAVRLQVEDVIRGIRAALRQASGGIPQLKLLTLDDGAAALEFRLRDRRLVFTLENNSEESGWHFVSTDSFNAFGELRSVNYVRLLDLLTE